MKLSLAILGLVVMITGAVLSGAMFTVTEKNQAIVLQFGNPKRVITDPGLYFKIPFIQDLVYYDKRILDLDPPFEQLTLKDKKRINVDTYARYRITDPLAFFTSARTESGFLSNFGPILNGSVRNEMGKHPLVNLLSKKRDDIMELIQGRASKAAKRFGVMVVDVRIGRTDYRKKFPKTFMNGCARNGFKKLTSSAPKGMKSKLKSCPMRIAKKRLSWPKQTKNLKFYAVKVRPVKPASSVRPINRVGNFSTSSDPWKPCAKVSMRMTPVWFYRLIASFSVFSRTPWGVKRWVNNKVVSRSLVNMSP